MAQRVLVVEESRTVAAALRRPLERAGFKVDESAPEEALSMLDVGVHALAIVRPEASGGIPVVDLLKKADPTLPVVLVFPDEDEAEAGADALVADGLLVGPLIGPVVVSCCRSMSRLRAQAMRIAELERAKPSVKGLQDYEFFKKLLLMEVKRSRRYRYPISMALVAVDRWKEVAAKLDRRSRAALLSDLLRVVAGAVRDIDLPIIYSEDRFLVFMPHTRGDGAQQVSSRIVSRVRARKGAVAVTVSAGVSTFEGEGAVSFSALTKAAAGALAHAQATGGDQSVRAGGARKRERVSIG
jgi:two-component system, cell cycle response regulator